MTTPQLTPQDIIDNLDRFPAEHPVTIRAPLNEWGDRLAYPLQILNLGAALDIGEIRLSDNLNAKPLEGVGQLQTTFPRDWCERETHLDSCEKYPG